MEKKRDNQQELYISIAILLYVILAVLNFVYVSLFYSVIWFVVGSIIYIIANIFAFTIIFHSSIPKDFTQEPGYSDKMISDIDNFKKSVKDATSNNN
jgi:uncharacterized membrane protein